MSKTVKILIGALVAIALIAIIAMVVVLLIGSPEEVEPTAVPPTTAPTPETGVDDSWERVQAAGKIVVGTSADYPPFEFYVGNLQIDGFDIALMDEIGRRLGVQVDYRDFAFDGLDGALQLRQIDIAIAAISVTPERESSVDFSNIYLVGEDAILAREDSSVSLITSLDELAGYRVGVQRGTAYEALLQRELVDTGKMPAGNLFAYDKGENAVRDLVEQRLDLVVGDAQPAEVAVASAGVKIVGRGLNQQRYAIALPKGAQALKAEIDRVLTDLQNEGVLAQLAKRYLNVDQLLPTPTPGPTSTAAPPPACVDGMAFVEHPGGEGSAAKPIQKKPGEAFSKVWRIKNTGTCTWDGSYKAVYVSGNRPGAQMGGQPTAIQGEVAPGQTYDLAVNLVAPLQAADYQAIWQMENGPGQAFGERLKVSVNVLAGPTATPAPTQTPVAGISFAVDRTNIKHGECVNFTWKVENVKEVYFYSEGENWPDHGVAGEGSSQECPPHTITYYLRVVKRDNAVVVRQITIYVEPAPDAPTISRFTVDPPNQITLGQCVKVRWEVQGSVDRVKIMANGGTLWDNAPTTGSYEHCPSAAGMVGYGIEAVGPGGTSRGQQNVNVVESATATPVPTSAPEKPVIYSFSASPNQIADGQCVDINWSAGGGASKVKVLRNSAVIVDNGPLTGHEEDCPSPPGTYTYRLEAHNSAGESASQQKTVNVSEGTPSNPLANTRWLATVINGELVLSGTSLTANFGDDGGLNGSAGCNSYSAGYSVSGGSLTITPPSASNKLCADPAGIMEQEAAYLAALQSAAGLSLDGGELIITDGSNVAVLEFVPISQ